jgi:hypothetical protein
MMFLQVISEVGSVAAGTLHPTLHPTAVRWTAIHTTPCVALIAARQLEVHPHRAGVLCRRIEIIGNSRSGGLGEIYHGHAVVRGVNTDSRDSVMENGGLVSKMSYDDDRCQLRGSGNALLHK